MRQAHDFHVEPMQKPAESLVIGFGLGGIEDFLHAYSLSTKEGLALMVLAEALLRVPDAVTADRLIEDKLAAGRWLDGDVKSTALLVSASAWTLGIAASFAASFSSSEGRGRGNGCENRNPVATEDGMCDVHEIGGAGQVISLLERNRAHGFLAPADAVIAILSKYTKQPADTIRPAIPWVDAQVRLDSKDVRHQIEWFTQQGQMKPGVKPDEIIDKRYVVPLPGRE